MLEIIKRHHNGNGAINGRGLAHRKWRGQRLRLAADVATGERQLVPSFGQLSSLFDVSTADLRAELKAREAHQRQLAERDERKGQAAEQPAEAVSVATTNDATVETVEPPATTTSVVSVVADMQALANRLLEISDQLWCIGNDIRTST